MMMHLQNVRAVAHPQGNRIDLFWENPDPANNRDLAVRIVRRRQAFPRSFEEGTVVPNLSLPPRFKKEFTTVGSASADLVHWFNLHAAPLADGANIFQESGSSGWFITYQEHLYRVCRVEESGWFYVYNDRLPFASDRDLQAEMVYYYVLVPYDASSAPPSGDIEYGQRVAEMASGPYDFERQLFDALPRIYHRYDEAHEAQLQRFLALPGGQLDLLYSKARGLLQLYDLERVDGTLLPIVAQWIGWKLDIRRGIERDRNEIRSAPFIYQALGTVPTLEATVKRVLGRACRAKEFMHNVFQSNNPPRLNLYVAETMPANPPESGESGSGTGDEEASNWQLPAEPLSIDFAYEGRPSVVVMPDPSDEKKRTLWLFYHTKRQRQWDICYKRLEILEIDDASQAPSKTGTIGKRLLHRMALGGVKFSPTTKILFSPAAAGKSQKWLLQDEASGLSGVASVVDDQLQVGVWHGGYPLTNRTVMDRHPTAVALGQQIWLFWDVYDKENCAWRIDCLQHDGQNGWASCEKWPFKTEGSETEEVQRKRPWAVGDDLDGIWLFWWERKDTQPWRLMFNRYDGKVWQSSVALVGSGGVPVPKIGGQYVRFSDLFVLFEPARQPPPMPHPGPYLPKQPPRLWVIGARKEPIESGQTHWKICYLLKKLQKIGEERDKYKLEGGWEKEIYEFEPPGRAAGAIFDDREPTAHLNSEEQIELFWSSNSGDSSSIWYSHNERLWTPSPGLIKWTTAEEITAGPYMQRDSLPVLSADKVQLFYRSNQPLTYSSPVYQATETLDGRYVGSTTLDMRALAQQETWGKYEDFQSYVCHVKQDVSANKPQYAANTVGIYLDRTEDESRPKGLGGRKGVLQDFLPAQVRPVFLTPSGSDSTGDDE